MSKALVCIFAMCLLTQSALAKPILRKPFQRPKLLKKPLCAKELKTQAEDAKAKADALLAQDNQLREDLTSKLDGENDILAVSIRRVDGKRQIRIITSDEKGKKELFQMRAKRDLPSELVSEIKVRSYHQFKADVENSLRKFLNDDQIGINAHINRNTGRLIFTASISDRSKIPVIQRAIAGMNLGLSLLLAVEHKDPKKEAKQASSKETGAAHSSSAEPTTRTGYINDERAVDITFQGVTKTQKTLVTFPEGLDGFDFEAAETVAEAVCKKIMNLEASTVLHVPAQDSEAIEAEVKLPEIKLLQVIYEDSAEFFKSSDEFRSGSLMLTADTYTVEVYLPELGRKTYSVLLRVSNEKPADRLWLGAEYKVVRIAEVKK